jgi:hypothetical protein
MCDCTPSSRLTLLATMSSVMRFVYFAPFFPSKGAYSHLLTANKNKHPKSHLLESLPSGNGHKYATPPLSDTPFITPSHSSAFPLKLVFSGGLNSYKTVKLSLYTPWRHTYRERRAIAPLILNLGTIWKAVVNFTPRPLYHRQINSGTHWAGGWLGPRVGLESFWKTENFLSLPGFEPRTVKPVASRNTNYAIRAPCLILIEQLKWPQGYASYTFQNYTYGKCVSGRCSQLCTKVS